MAYLVKMKKALCNCFKEIFDRLLYYGMNCNPHWNKNFEAASPQASDCTSQFVTWFHLVNILWKGMNHTESALRGAAAKPPRAFRCKAFQFIVFKISFLHITNRHHWDPSNTKIFEILNGLWSQYVLCKSLSNLLEQFSEPQKQGGLNKGGLNVKFRWSK